jgi:hypothetical protein
MHVSAATRLRIGFRVGQKTHDHLLVSAQLEPNIYQVLRIDLTGIIRDILIVFLRSTVTLALLGKYRFVSLAFLIFRRLFVILERFLGVIRSSHEYPADNKDSLASTCCLGVLHRFARIVCAVCPGSVHPHEIGLCRIKASFSNRICRIL